MTVEELIALLQKEDPQASVLFAADAEGNEYSGFGAIDVAYVEPDWQGERVEEVLFEEDFEFDDTEDDESEYGEKSAYKKVVVVWPV